MTPETRAVTDKRPENIKQLDEQGEQIAKGIKQSRRDWITFRRRSAVIRRGEKQKLPKNKRRG